jgi:hypothetical protein
MSAKNIVYRCFYAVASDARDASRCEAIEKAGTRDKCIHEVAKYYLDRNVCAGMKDSADKDRCLEYAAK